MRQPLPMTRVYEDKSSAVSESATMEEAIACLEKEAPDISEIGDFVTNACKTNNLALMIAVIASSLLENKDGIVKIVKNPPIIRLFKAAFSRCKTKYASLWESQSPMSKLIDETVRMISGESTMEHLTFSHVNNALSLRMHIPEPIASSSEAVASSIASSSEAAIGPSDTGGSSEFRAASPDIGVAEPTEKVEDSSEPTIPSVAPLTADVVPVLNE